MAIGETTTGRKRPLTIRDAVHRSDVAQLVEQVAIVRDTIAAGQLNRHLKNTGLDVRGMALPDSGSKLLLGLGVGTRIIRSMLYAPIEGTHLANRLAPGSFLVKWMHLSHSNEEPVRTLNALSEVPTYHHGGNAREYEPAFLHGEFMGKVMDANDVIHPNMDEDHFQAIQAGFSPFYEQIVSILPKS